MKIDQLREQAEKNKDVPVCDPCQRAYEDGLEEGGQPARIRKILKDMRKEAEEYRYKKPSPTIPRLPGQELPIMKHNFLPMVCCLRPIEHDSHLGAVGGE